MIFCIAGTGDGRALALRLRKENWPVLVSVVSEYGERLVQEAELPVVQTALDQAGMEAFLQEQGIRLVVDASHPYAVNVSRNAMAACEKVKVPYVRYERPASDLPEYKKLHIAGRLRRSGQAGRRFGRDHFFDHRESPAWHLSGGAAAARQASCSQGAAGVVGAGTVPQPWLFTQRYCGDAGAFFVRTQPGAVSGFSGGGCCLEKQRPCRRLRRENCRSRSAGPGSSTG